jgi:type IV pilus assembly protein PilW
MNLPLLHRREAGFSLIELMVGMLIGLIGIVIITHLYITNDRYKRSTTGSGTAQVNGAVALYTLEREIRMGGYGVNHSAALGCTCAGVNCSPVQYYYNGFSSFPPAGAAAGALPARVLAPVVITDNPGGPDSITVLYSAANERMLPAALSADTIAPNHDYKVDGIQGFQDNNLVLVTQGGTCLLRQISKVQTGTTMLEHHSGANAFDPAASLGPGFTAGAAVFNLGTLTATSGPVWRTFSVGNVANAYRLQSEDVLRSLATFPAPGVQQQLVDDIVDLQAQYGKDDGSVPGSVADDGVVDVWNTVQPPDATAWRRVLAVRVGVLARSQNFEKPSVAGGPCEATTAAPTWSGGAFTVPGGLPNCYKHRVFETVIPMRNMIWRPA